MVSIVQVVQVHPYLVVNTEGLIAVLNELMNGQSSVVWLDDRVRDLGRWDNRESRHHAVWELFSNLGDQQCSHTSTSTATKGVSDLETLEAVTAFGFTTNNIEDLVDQFSSFSVVTLGPVISCT